MICWSIFRGWWIWKKYNCQADEDHSRERVHSRGLQTVPAGGFQQHNPVASSHPQSHAKPGGSLRRRGKRGEKKKSYSWHRTKTRWNHKMFHTGFPLPLSKDRVGTAVLSQSCWDRRSQSQSFFPVFRLQSQSRTGFCFCSKSTNKLHELVKKKFWKKIFFCLKCPKT